MSLVSELWRRTEFLTNHGVSVIVYKEMFWTALSLFYWQSVMRASQAGPAYVKIETMYIVRIVSFVLVDRGLCLHSMECNAAWIWRTLL